MFKSNNIPLVIASICCFLAATAHLVCIYIGPDGYRFMGAGEHMAQLAASGSIEPTVVTLLIACALYLWSIIALSGAGVIKKLPFCTPILIVISCVLIARGTGFFLLIPLFPDNSMTFWWVSSGICLFMGLSFALGTWKSVKAD